MGRGDRRPPGDGLRPDAARDGATGGGGDGIRFECRACEPRDELYDGSGTVYDISHG